MRRRTLKRAKRDRVADKWRKAQIAKVGRCEWCLKKRKPDDLTVHEIGLARGGNRVHAQDKAFSTLVLCKIGCHQLLQNARETLELAVLKRSRPGEYDLAAHLFLTRPGAPKRIEPWEVEAETRKLRG